MAFGGKVHDSIGLMLGKERRHRRRIADVGLDELMPLVAFEIGQ